MKLKVGIMSMLFLLSLLVVPVVAEEWIPPIDWQPKWAFFVGYGTVVCDDEITPSLTWGHRCHFRFVGGKIGDTWRGRGRWVDRDWDEGILVAVVTIKEGFLQHDPNPGHIMEIFALFGVARVYVGGVYKGTYKVRLEMADADAGITDGTAGTQPDWIGFTICDFLNGDDYYSGHPRLISGDLMTWWYPEYSEE